MPRAGASLAQPPPIRWDAISSWNEHQLAGGISGLAGPVSLDNYCLYAAISGASATGPVSLGDINYSNSMGRYKLLKWASIGRLRKNRSVAAIEKGYFPNTKTLRAHHPKSTYSVGSQRAGSEGYFARTQGPENPARTWLRITVIRAKGLLKTVARAARSK